MRGEKRRGCCWRCWCDGVVMLLMMRMWPWMGYVYVLVVLVVQMWVLLLWVWLIWMRVHVMHCQVRSHR